ncbi:putative tRNA (adenine(37)-N6)-methyltransferase [Anaerohalosphaera lusitana]|uniref:Putative tRNA (Adenine(37)-N6)-methyltransferase n=1 Tax=Anaerohalosphaera lusitana TaxID=1936003 RepID=A0A1U9NHZ8_9BACT|nr:tRNA (N6-threonylcarbamoyladenosine(37)-N6)-methyltransferase TrmO [Anaerohalosphaera lusitana]AQT67230.1 putative tRNA (adenine(37)-N6)-methyltransferase [Anaerohalosphaera lusitana]
MNTQKIQIQPIGIIHSPFKQLQNMPIQPKGAPDTTGTIEIFEQYAPGLTDLAGFSHIYLLYHFHHARETRLRVTPFMDTVTRGVYSTRAPVRPNHIGLSVVELLEVQQNILTIKGVDILDGTPLIDIKPYIEKFDHPQNTRSGWMNQDQKTINQKRSDNRFV